MKRALLILPVALLAAACGSSSSTTTPSAPSGSSGSSGVSISTRNVSGVGTVLVSSQGRTLYVFAPDKASKVTCTGQCAAVWPPLKIASGGKPSVSGGVQASLVSSKPDPAGGSVVTYAGWPLYMYVADPTAGTAHGQALNSSGGIWYAISPSGTVIKKAPASTKSGAPGY